MKKLTMTLCIALAAAGIIAVQAKPTTHAGVLPYPTCPPSCPLK